MYCDVLRLSEFLLKKLLTYLLKKYKDVDIEAVACVHNLQYSSVQFSTVHDTTCIIYLLPESWTHLQDTTTENSL